jgi:hypothetical protein
VGSYLHGIPASNQSAILGGCALIVLKQFDGDPDGLKWMTEAVPAETSFDFLCSEQFWRGFEELAPAVRSNVIRCAATLCPFRKDIATWILSEMVRLSLGAGREKQAVQVGSLLGNPKLNAFLLHCAQV